MTVTTINPATGEVLVSYEETSAEAVDAILDRARVCRLRPPGERGQACSA